MDVENTSNMSGFPSPTTQTIPCEPEPPKKWSFKKKLIVMFVTIIAITITITLSVYFTWPKTSYTMHMATDGAIYVEWSGPSNLTALSNNPKVQTLKMIFTAQNEDEFRIQIIPVSTPGYHLPDLDPYPIDRNITSMTNGSNFKVYFDEKLLYFKVVRTSTNEVIFDTSGFDLIFQEYYMQMTVSLPSDKLFGFGERSTSFRLKEGTYTTWGQDMAQMVETGTEGHQGYGYHPMYLTQEKSGNFYISLMRTTTPMSVKVSRDNDHFHLEYKMVSGVYDLKFFLGDKNPETVIKKYHTYLGGWQQQGFWAFGFHQSRWGYKNIDDYKSVANSYDQYKLPLDTIWSDIDYMYRYFDFTIDTTKFPTEQLHDFFEEKKLHWVPIIDAGVAKESDSFADGEKAAIWINTTAPGGGPLTAWVWPGYSTFVDFLNPNASQYWSDQLSKLYNKIQFDGIWLDMNEVASFCQGECPPNNNRGPALTQKFPYNPQGRDSLENKTISLDAQHYGGVLELDAHSQFGFLETMATNQFLKKNGQQFPFVLSRSTMYGSGKYGAHWTGDNGATYEFLELSISQIMNFNMFGVPFTGADICGFYGPNVTDETMCAVWYQIGALYPFARNHASIDTTRHEPYLIGPNALKAAQNSMGFRYSILKYYYSLFIRANGLGTIYKPVFFEFPSDAELYEAPLIDYQFMIGSALMGVYLPIIFPSKLESSGSVYFPVDRWYNYHTGEIIMKGIESNGQFKTISSSVTAPPPVYVRGGNIIPQQNPDNSVLRVANLGSTYGLLLALKNLNTATGFAEGHIMAVGDYDDQTRVLEQCLQNGTNCMAKVNATFDAFKKQYHIKIVGEKSYSTLDTFSINKLTIYGTFALDYPPSTLQIANMTASSDSTGNQKKIDSATSSFAGDVLTVKFDSLAFAGPSLDIYINVNY